MKDLFPIIQIAICLFLSGLVLFQTKGAGLGKSFGGQSNFSTKRGVEKLFFRLTILVSFLFLASSLIQTIVF